MPKLVALQVLRALAALAVATLHGRYEARLLAAAHEGVAPAAGFAWEAGVDVFFVVSGFVMVVSSGPLFGARGGRAVFLARRIARVVPLYWLATTLFLAVALTGPALLNGPVLQPGFVLASYLFVPAARPDGLVQPVFGLGWTLNFEMFFYGLFALALALPRRAAVAALVAALAALAAAGGLSAWPQPTWPQPFATWSDPIILEFAAGAALGLGRAEGVLVGAGPRIALGIVGAALYALVPPDLAGLPRAVLYGVPAVFLVAACGLGLTRNSAEGRAARIAVALGDASYALYLTHVFVLRAVRVLVAATGLGAALAGWPFLLTSLAFAAAAAVAVHRLVERPMTRATRRLLERGFSSRRSSC